MQDETLFNRDDFYRKMEGLLNVPAGSVRGNEELKDLKSWDSLTILEFIVLADNDYKSEVQPTDITECKTVDDLARVTFAQSSLHNERVNTGD